VPYIQTLQRRSLLYEYHTVSRYERKRNFIYDRNEKRHDLPGRYSRTSQMFSSFMFISLTRSFHEIGQQRWAVWTKIHLRSPSKKQHSLRRFSRTSQSLNKLLRALPLPNFIQIRRQMYTTGQNSTYAPHVKYAFHHNHFQKNRTEMQTEF